VDSIPSPSRPFETGILMAAAIMVRPIVCPSVSVCGTSAPAGSNMILIPSTT